jgi:hypothetical protein
MYSPAIRVASGNHNRHGPAGMKARRADEQFPNEQFPNEQFPNEQFPNE